MLRLFRHVICCSHNDVCALMCAQIRTSNARTHTVNADSQRHGAEIQAYRVPRKTVSSCWTSLATYFGVAGVSLPVLIFPTTLSIPSPRGFVNTPVPSGRRLAFTWFGCSPQKLWLALGTRAEPIRSADAARGSAAAPLSRCSSPHSALRSGKRSSSIKTFDISFYGYLHSSQGSRVRKLH